MQIGTELQYRNLCNICNLKDPPDISNTYKRGITIGGDNSQNYDCVNYGFTGFANPYSDTMLVGIGSSTSDRYYLKKLTTYCEVYNGSNIYRYTYSWTDTSTEKYVKQPASHANWNYIVIVTYNDISNEIIFVLFNKTLKTFELYNTCDASKFGFSDKENYFQFSQITSSAVAGYSGEVLV
jgi:hypothetical protein